MQINIKKKFKLLPAIAPILFLHHFFKNNLLFCFLCFIIYFNLVIISQQANKCNYLVSFLFFRFANSILFFSFAFLFLFSSPFHAKIKLLQIKQFIVPWGFIIHTSVLSGSPYSSFHTSPPHASSHFKYKA